MFNNFVKIPMKNFTRVLLTVFIVSIFSQFLLLSPARVSAAAVPDWGSNLRVNTTITADAQVGSVITRTTAGDYIVIWQDQTSNRNYAQKIDTSGTLIWGSDVALTSGSNGSDYFDVVADTSGGVFSMHTYNNNLYVNHIDADGNIWQLNGIQVYNDQAGDTEYMGNMVSDGAGGVFVTWQAVRLGAYYVNVTHLDGTGALSASWNIGGTGTFKTVEFADTETGYDPHLIDGGGAAILYLSYEGNGNSVLTRKLSDTGTDLWGDPGVTSNANGIDGWTTYSDGAGGLYIGYNSYSNWPYNMRISHMDDTASTSWTTTVGTSFNLAPYPHLMEDGSGGIIMVWNHNDSLDWSETDVYGQRVNSSGTALWNGGSAMAVINSTYNETLLYDINHSIVSDGAGGIYIAAGTNDASSSTTVQHVLADGTKDFGPHGYHIGNNTWFGTLAPDGSGGTILTYTGDDTGDYDIWAQRLVSAFIPTIDSVLPTTIPLAGQSITIYGTEFNDVISVTVNGDTCTDLAFDVENPTTIMTCTAPAETAGTYDVAAYTTSYDSGTSGNGLLSYADLTVDPDTANIDIYMDTAPAGFPGWSSIASGISNGDDVTALTDLDFPGTPIYSGSGNPNVSGGIRYSFYSSGEPYVDTPTPSVMLDTTGAATITLGDEAYSNVIDMGFTAKMYGKDVRYFRINSNGFVIFSEDNIIDNDCNIFSCWNSDASMSGNRNLPPGVDGTAGGDIIVAIKWSDYNTVGVGNVLNYKIDQTGSYNRLLITGPNLEYWGSGTYETFQLTVTTPATTEPVISSIVDNYDVIGGGKTITLTGVYYVDPSTIDFGGAAATNVTVTSPTTITATVPAHSAGYVDVTISNANGTSLVYPFLYYGTPTLTNISPSSGPVSGGYTATVNGLGFGPETTLTVDGNPVTINSRTGTTLNFNVPAGIGLGAVPVVVTNPGDQTANGSFTYTPSDLQITDVSGSDQSSPSVITTSDGNYLIVWQDERNTTGWPSNRDIYAQKINSSTGATMWTSDGLAITNQTLNQPWYTYNVKLSPDSSGGAFMSWDTDAPGNNDIYVNHIDTNGDWTANWTDGSNPGINVSSTNTNQDHFPQVVSDGSGGVYASWTQYNGTWPSYDIVVTHLDGGTADVTNINWPQTISIGDWDDYAQLVPSGDGGIFVISWEYPSEGIYLTKYNSDGVIQAPFNNILISAVATQTTEDFKAVSDGNGGIVLTYKVNAGIKASHVDSSGSFIWDNIDVHVAGKFDPSPTRIDAIYNSNGELYVVWEHYNEDGDSPLFAQKVDSGGTPLIAPINFANNGYFPSAGNNNKNYLADDNNGGIMVTFRDRDVINVTQILANESYVNNQYGLATISTNANPMITMNGNDGLVAWNATSPNESLDIYAKLISAQLPVTVNISSISPNTADINETVTITGTGLNDAISVTIDGEECSIQTNSSTEITCITSTPLTSTSEIVVTTINGSDLYNNSPQGACGPLGTSEVCGSVSLNCSTRATTFGNTPNDFQMGSTGSRLIKSTNDASFNANESSAYFDKTAPGTFADETNTLSINSNTVFSCGDAGQAVSLTVDATRFVNGTGDPLLTYGEDGALGGSGADSDYWAIFSVITSGTTTCDTNCAPAAGNVESNNEAKNGQNNYFANEAANDGSLNVSFDNNAVLLDSTNQVNTVTLYNSSTGLEGNVAVPGLDFNLALPANLQFIGSFTSTVTYTLS